MIGNVRFTMLLPRPIQAHDCPSFPLFRLLLVGHVENLREVGYRIPCGG
jgi:hypothetical protein